MSAIHIFTNFEGSVHKISLDINDYIELGCPKLAIVKRRPKDKYLNVRILRNNTIKLNNFSITSLSRVLSKCPDNLVVDHINHNPLDNRKINLRNVTPQENSWRTRSHSDSMYSKFKGVSYDGKGTKSKPWQAKISVKNITRKKRFATELEAANWYNEQALELHGAFAVLNDV